MHFLELAAIPTLTWPHVLLRLVLAAALGGAIGLERELRERQAGLRTHLVVCLGSALFTIVSAYGFREFLVHGGSVVRASVPMHGNTSTIEHDGRGVFSGLVGPFVASRYHSLIVSDQGLPAELEVSARTREDGAIMGLRHRVWPVHGVQFHPESILTGEGRRILGNFIEGRAD